MGKVTAAAFLIAGAPSAAYAQGPSVEDRLKALEARQTELEQALRERDARIAQLEAERDRAASPTQAAIGETPPAQLAATAPTTPAPTSQAVQPPHNPTWGAYEPGKGLVLARSDKGELDFGVFSYARYVNQKGLDATYTDSFGRTFDLDRRNDLQLQKVTLNFKGWLLDPDFRYLFYVWTSNTNQGLAAQVVVGGNVSYHFSDALTLGAGIASLPSTRSTNWNFPNWLKIDNRTMADEYFRGSFTTGLFASGDIAPGLKYRAMIGNNLSQLGVDAAQLDGGLNTVSGALWWMPTTGEYGPAEGFGDFEQHKELATLFGAHYTRSREDAQSQPGTESFENAQIRLSDGTLIFSADPFGTGGQIREATYQMAAVNAGAKYRGFSLDGEYYWRWVDNFETVGAIPVTDLFDHGFQLQGSAMVIPQTLQAYVSGSKIFGEFGNPWDVALGMNWHPFQRREIRINAQALYMKRSAVGYTGIPYLVGGNGWVFSSDFVVAF